MKYVLIVILSFSFSFGYGQYSRERIDLEKKFISCVKYNLIGRQDRAIDTLLMLNAEYPENAAILYQLSKGYALDKNWSKSVAYGREAYQKEPNHTYQRHLGDIALQAEDFPLAIDTWKPLFEKDNANEEFGDKLATAYLLNQDFKSSIKTYNQMEKIVGIKENITRRKVEIYKILNDKKGMEKELVNLSNAYPENLTYLKNLAKYYKNNNQMKKAIKVFEKAKKIDPSIVKQIKPIDPRPKSTFKHFESWKTELTTLYNGKKYNELQIKSFQALDLYPNEAIAYWYNGKALNALKRYTEAELILAEAILVASGDDIVQSQIYSELAYSLLAQKKKEKAKSFLETALNLDSNNKQAMSLIKKL